MKLSFERILIGFFLAIIAGVILLGVVNYNNTKAYSESTHWVDHTNEVLKETAKTQSMLQDIGVRGYITTGDSSFLTSYIAAKANIEPQLQKLDELTKDNPAQKDRVDTLQAFAAQRLALAEIYLQLYRNDKLTKDALGTFTKDSRTNMDGIRRTIAAIANDEETLLQTRKDKTEKDKRDFDFSVALVFGVIAILLIACMLTVIYYINKRRNYENNILRLNDELKKKVDELNSANKELESFSYSVSHDLRAPLRIIDGFAKIISEEHSQSLNDEGNRFIETIRANAQRMGMLIDDLLNFSRVGRLALNLREINMNNTVQHVVDSFKVLDKDLPADIQLQSLKNCKCDEHLIQQVWINLISNALKYSRNRSSPLVIIGCRDSASELIYFVQDNGVGFDMEFAGKLFGVFQRLHKASDYEGTGVGLALVSRIVIRHKGRVWAEAKPDEGATFFFSIPKC